MHLERIGPRVVDVLQVDKGKRYSCGGRVPGQKHLARNTFIRLGTDMELACLGLREREQASNKTLRGARDLRLGRDDFSKRQCRDRRCCLAQKEDRTNSLVPRRRIVWRDAAAAVVVGLASALVLTGLCIGRSAAFPKRATGS